MTAWAKSSPLPPRVKLQATPGWADAGPAVSSSQPRAIAINPAPVIRHRPGLRLTRWIAIRLFLHDVNPQIAVCHFHNYQCVTAHVLLANVLRIKPAAGAGIYSSLRRPIDHWDYRAQHLSVLVG